ncbi:hypothetical protein COX69_00620 [Candidatus Falkowbacteria bacterium CG_4_10_14_0_2_um_filter_48_10]|uniref:Transcription regulator TrmB N-terminal domain-containing protein n=1 Tax=Candidatus Falkowbacteria bacterium CG23_combo_of_CG06-09_8_20_14_all_49_15 TaxID=1974572 RepID=A0A2G9ZP11_9BACT|nr:MAG: hypothetical protein COX22_00890 [Candidatus Falkowbacteria bacterium CG23_combo_of_CG06-09_8_20_14_all_49_15]PJA09106.1 MAG: hypothetical protein COX69_00620 [Candidatus Falkowbacteria bacterium CG_4_10_14_0_2_um_filter_48_10]
MTIIEEIINGHMDKSLLKKLGLSDKEIAVYLKLLEYGALSVRSLAAIAGLNRGTVYDLLKNLQAGGLVSYFHESTKQKFVAEDPEKIQPLLAAKEADLREVKKGLVDLIPELKSLQDKEASRPTTKFYEGKNGIRLILEDVLKVTADVDVDKEYYIYSATKASDDLRAAYPDFTRDRVRKKIAVKAISLARGGRLHGLDERRWLGTHDESATYIIIYAGRCAFISRDHQGAPLGVIIENTAIYETQKIIFLRLWEMLGRTAAAEK